MRERPTYRRSRHAVAYWEPSGVVLYNPRHGVRVRGSGVLIDFLSMLDDWRTVDELSVRSRLRPSDVAAVLARMGKLKLVERRSRRPGAKRTPDVWESWSPAATLFHFSTKDVPFAPRSRSRQIFRRRLASRLPPPPTKPFDRRRSIALPAALPLAPLRGVLLTRRTWRRFRDAPATMAELSTALDLTFRAQAWADLGALGRVMLRTSPSGGARHPIEAYVLAANVDGLRRGLYHYAPEHHRLVPVRVVPQPRRAIARLLPTQPWYERAAVVVFMTAVFGRTEWPYPFARAYRNVLIEAGHVCQTFCLVATAMGLAPFCTAALADSDVERALRIDGAAESVLYAAGFGARPGGRNPAAGGFPR